MRCVRSPNPAGKQEASVFNWIDKLLKGTGKSASTTTLNETANEVRVSVQGDDSAAWQKRGNAFLGDSDLRQAIDCYQRALAIDPGYANACISLAYVLMEQNNHEEAVQYLERALCIDPANADVHYMLGSVASSRNDAAAAARHWHAALELRPDFDRAWQDLINLGNTLQAGGDLDAAADTYRQALQIKPGDIIASNNLGLILDKQGKHDDAIALLDKTASIAPNAAEVHFNLGNIVKALGNLPQAIERYRKALSIDPNLVDAHLNLGSALQTEDKLDEAIASYRRALAIKPDYVLAYNNLGLALGKRKEYEEAIALFEKALDIDPDDPVVHNNLGHVLLAQDKLDASTRHIRRALEIKPDHAEAFYNLGNALTRKYELETVLVNENKARSNDAKAPLAEQNLPEAAIECFRKAVSIKPDYAAAYCNLGAALQVRGRIDEAIDCYHQALAIDPELATAHWNESLCLLLTGDFNKGWEKYEWRWKNKQLKKPPTEFVQPRWHGKESLQGKTILLWGEQGLGDTIQFCRYATKVAAQGATVLLSAPAALKPLLARMPSISAIITEGETLPDSDYHCSLMSLPFAFDTTIDTIPADVPYLHADPVKCRQWQTQLQQHTGLRVGLVWSGGFRPDQPEIWSTNERRNIPLRKLAPLNLPGIDFFSLQIGDYGVRQLTELREASWDGPAIIDYTDAIADFSDTAALIDNLDLVICVDTSTAHLAGAMGKPVWILNRFDTCWRWLLERSDSPWYPSARLFRQPTPGDWDSVIADVADALADAVRSGMHSRSTHVQLD
jgi:tetratricopeptide (TPR) repeat protein